MTGAAGGGGGGGGGRHAAQVAAGIVVTRVLGYVRERVFAHYFGNEAVADAFRAALRIPNVLRNLLGEGTLSASFIPVYAALRERPGAEAARVLAGAVLGLLAAGAGVLATAGIALAPAITTAVAPGFEPETRRLTVTLVRLLFPMSGLMVVSAWCLGILNTHRRFFLPYAAPALWNVAGIAALVGAGTWLVTPAMGGAERLERLALALAWGTVAGGVLQVAVQLPACWRLLGGLRLRASVAVEGVRDVLIAWVPLVLGAGVAQVAGLVDTVLGSLAGPGSVASLSYAQLVQTLPISLFGVSVAAVALPELARDAARTAAADVLRRRLAAGFRRIGFFVVPSAVACVGLGPVMIGALFQTGRFGAADTALVGGVLAAYGPGLLWYASVKLLASGFYALRDTRTPVRITVVSLAASTALAVALMRPYGAAGIALASSLGAGLQFVLLRAGLDRRLGTVLDAATWRATGMVGVAALVALAGGVSTARLGAALSPVPLAGASLAIFGTTYLALTSALRHPDALALWTFLRPSRGS